MDYDLAIIGGGWAGFNAAIRARQLGLKVCLVEKDKIGGTCLNRGCIPTKALIQSTKIYSLICKSSDFGIETTNPQINFHRIQSRKDKIVQQLSQGMNFMLKGIDFIPKEARILSPETISIGDRNIRVKFILIATGSRPAELRNIKFDGKKILSSDDVLNLTRIPRSLLIIGGGVIGCEFASLFSVLGAQVTIVEKMPQLLPGEDKEIAKKIETIFKKRGIKVSTDTDALSLDLGNYELVLLSIGRVPQTYGLGIDNLGVNLEKDRIVVDEYLRSNIPNIYAAGDCCCAKFMLAHFAAYQGRVAAQNIACPGNPKRADNAVIPSCIFTDPEIASVGLNEDGAKNKGIDVLINKFDFLGSGMARILGETEGFIKIISDKNTSNVLGASIIGPRATELIGIFSLAISNNLKISQIKDTIFAHPTLSEGIQEALSKDYGL